MFVHPFSAAVPPTVPSEVPGTCPTDACPGSGGWDHYGEDCFLFCPDMWNTWDEAAEDCQMYGAFLTVIMSDEENRFVHHRLEETTNLWEGIGRPYWIGYAKKNSSES